MAPTPKSGWPSRRRLTSVIGLVLGVGALVGLTLYAGVDDIAKALAAGGPALLLLVGFHVFQIGPHTLAWGVIFPPAERPRWRRLAPATWVGQSVNLLLPVANLGGDLVRVRLLVLARTRPPVAIASVIADKTSQAATAFALLALGIALLAAQHADASLIAGTAATAGLLGLGVLGFIRLQRSQGTSAMTARLARSGKDAMVRIHASTQEVERELRAIYTRPWAFVLAVALRVGSAVLLALEVWAAGALMGLDLSLLDAVTLRVVGFAVRGAAFFVWGGLGVQEGMFAAVGALYGLPPAALIAVSLATRVREIAVALPGVIYWLTVESMQAMKGKGSESDRPRIKGSMHDTTNPTPPGPSGD